MKPALENPMWLSHDEEPLVAKLKQSALKRHGFGPALAAGHHLRFHEPPADLLAGLVETALVSGTGPRVAVARDWLNAQSPARIEGWITSATGLAVRAMDDLESLQEWPVRGWRRALQRLLVHRDDLESLQQILCLSQDTAVVDEALAALDCMLRHFLDSLPVVPRLNSEQLMLASLRDRNAWWVGREYYVG